jgi:branched-chain amino acid transport system ATP-binding protein
MLKVKGVSCYFGGLAALVDVSLKVEDNELVGLMGPNGAGKTTLFNVISSFVSPDKGKVYLRGEEITHLSPYIIVRKGLVRTFQDVRIFNHLTVLENIEIAVPENRNIGFWKGIFPTSKGKLIKNFMKNVAMECLELVSLSKLQNNYAQSLTFGQRRLLGIARAFASRPKILLLDEPSAGLNQNETNALLEVIGRIHKRNIAILIIEHNIGMLMRLAQRIVVLDRGKKITEGRPDEIRKEKKVIKAYFGRKKCLV